MMRIETITLLGPEILLIGSAFLAIVGGAFWPSRTAWNLLGAISILLATVLAANSAHAFWIRSGVSQEGPLLIDALGITFRWMALLVGFLLMLLVSGRAAVQRGGETPGLMLILIAGLSLVAWVGNGILLFLALELISIPTYVLLFTGRSSRGSAEATVKYFLLSLLASALFLMGWTLLYGITGSFEFRVIADRLGGGGLDRWPRMGFLAFGLILGGLGFKLAAFPFHFYAPDVYQGTTHANAGVLAVVPKIAGLIALIRVLSFGFLESLVVGWPLLLFLAVITMTVGNVSALWQGKLRRILAYSSIAHAGYLLMGVTVALAAGETHGEHPFDGMSAALLYLVMYTVGSLGCFAALCELEGTGTEGSGREVATLEQLHGMGSRRPWIAGCLAISLFSLAGIPPFAGFWGKLGLFSATVNVSQAAEQSRTSGAFGVLAVAAALNAAIAAAYYLRIIAALYFFPSAGVDGARTARAKPSPAAFVAITAALVAVIMGVLPGPLWNHFQGVGESLGNSRATSAEAISRGVPVATPNPLR